MRYTHAVTTATDRPASERSETSCGISFKSCKHRLRLTQKRKKLKKRLLIEWYGGIDMSDREAFEKWAADKDFVIGTPVGRISLKDAAWEGWQAAQAQAGDGEGYEIEHRLSHLLAALEHAHKIAQTIPDLERQLKDFLDGIGYDLVARSPFVETEAAAEANPADDMTDWRNWREGDVVQITRDCFGAELLEGDAYPIDEVLAHGVRIRMAERSTASFGYTAIPGALKFHSRSARGSDGIN